MADEVSPEVIQSTQKLLGKHVTKPQLTEKLLKKPPFRFLHDIVVVLVRNGFLKGLYTDAELNSDNVKDRDSKNAFLNKLITAVKTISGKDLQVKSSKIIAGLDATETNRLLQTMGRLLDDKVDTREYVKNLKKTSKDVKKPGDNQESARDGANPKKTTSKTSLTKSTDKLDSTRKKTERIDKKPTRKNSDDVSPKVKGSLTPKTKVDPKKKTLKADKLDKTSSKTSVASKTSKTGITKASSKDKVSPKAGTSGASTTSTPKTPNSTKSIKETEKEESPIESVDKVDTIDNIDNIEEDVPQDVPEVPQLDNIVDSTPRDDSWKPQVINDDVNGDHVQDHDKPPSYRENYEDTVQKDVVDAGVLSRKSSTENDAIPSTNAVRQPSARPKSARPRSGSNDQRLPSAQIKNISDIKDTTGNSDAHKKPEIKPVMAIKDFSLKSANKDIPRENSSVAKNKENIMQNIDSDKMESEEIKRTTPFRPKSSMLRPPSVRPSSARPGAPRLRPESSLPMKEIVPLGKINVIVENFDAKDSNKDDDEDETVVIQSLPDEPVVENNFTEKSLNLDIPADKGHLVEQILEQMQDGGQGEKAQLEWEHEGSKSKDATTKEINALRGSIQALTKTANPLGKLASYLHEDVEAMHSELETWLNMKQQYTAEITKQKRVNTESNQPLLQQLHNLEESIKHERDEIVSIKYNILRNEERIRHLVSKQIAID